MMRNAFRCSFLAAAALAAVICGLSARAHAQLLLYEPFNYTVGENLGGTDPDGPGGASGNPTQGQTGTYVGGGSYKWRAHGTTSNYQANNDAMVSTGNLSYAGLAPSLGNSVSYGSNIDNVALYADAVPLPSTISSGSLYASFIIRIKSSVSGSQARHSLAGLLFETSNDGNAGAALTPQGGGTVNEPAMFWMRKNVSPPIVDTSFSPGKTNQDGIGPGALGPSAGWQHPSTGSQETNQFGNKSGQAPADFNNSETWQTYFVVLKSEFGATNSGCADSSCDDFDPPGSNPGGTNAQTHVVSLWMNPGSGTLGVANGEFLASQDPSGNIGSYFAAVDAYGTAGADSTAINSFALFGHRQNTVATVAVDIDELRIGRTWADVTPTTAAAQPGDHNGDGVVDAADYVAWRKTDSGNPQGYTDFVENFGEGMSGGAGGASSSSSQVPEPASAMLLLLAVTCFSTQPRFCSLSARSAR